MAESSQDVPLQKKEDKPRYVSYAVFDKSRKELQVKTHIPFHEAYHKCFGNVIAEEAYHILLYYWERADGSLRCLSPVRSDAYKKMFGDKTPKEAARIVLQKMSLHKSGMYITLDFLRKRPKDPDEGWYRSFLCGKKIGNGHGGSDKPERTARDERHNRHHVFAKSRKDFRIRIEKQFLSAYKKCFGRVTAEEAYYILLKMWTEKDEKDGSLRKLSPARQEAYQAMFGSRRPKEAARIILRKMSLQGIGVFVVIDWTKWNIQDPDARWRAIHVLGAQQEGKSEAK